MKKFVTLVILLLVAILFWQWGTWNNADTTAANGVEGAKSVFGAVGDAAKNAAGSVADTAGSVAGAVGDTAKNAAGAVADTAGSAVSAVGDAAKAVGDTAGAVAGAVGDTAKNAAGAVADTAGSAAGAVAGAVGDTAKNAAGAVAGALGATGTAATGVTKGALDAAKKMVGFVKNEAGQISGIKAESIYFHSGSDNLKNESLATVAAVAELVKSEKVKKVEIVGHTDASGNPGNNFTLSGARAKSVFQKLKEFGVSSEKLSYTGKGGDEPVATNKTTEGRAKNRRVEFKVYQ